MRNNNGRKDGFIKFPTAIYDSLLTTSLAGRELKVVLLIIRLTYGCQQQSCRIRQTDLKAIGIQPSHAKEVLNKILCVGAAEVTRGRYSFSLSWLSANTDSLRQELLTPLIGSNLPRRSQNGKAQLTQLGRAGLPKEEDASSQNGNYIKIPNQELSTSGNPDSGQAKDSVQIPVINSDIESYADLNDFKPKTAAEDAALRAWQFLEPSKPRSFGLYLKAARSGMTADDFDRFVAEIKQSPSTRNKGAVFAMKYKDLMVKRMSMS